MAKKQSARLAEELIQITAIAPNRGSVTAQPRMSTRFLWPMNLILMAFLKTPRTDRIRWAAIAAASSKGGSPWPQIEITLVLRSQARKTARSPLLQTIIRRPFPARSNTDLKTRSIRTPEGTKAAKDRTWIRAVLPVPVRSLVTLATAAAEAGQPSKPLPLRRRTGTVGSRATPSRSGLDTNPFGRRPSPERAERHRIAQLDYGWDVMFILRPRLLGHEVRRTPREHDLGGSRSPRGCRRWRRWRAIRPEFHSACRQQRDTSDDVVLGCIAMPADGRAWSILIDERHRKRIGVDTRPLRNRGTQWQQERRKRFRRPTIGTIGRRTRRDAGPRRHAFRSPRMRRRQWRSAGPAHRPP